MYCPFRGAIFCLVRTLITVKYPQADLGDPNGSGNSVTLVRSWSHQRRASAGGFAARSQWGHGVKMASNALRVLFCVERRSIVEGRSYGRTKRRLDQDGLELGA